MASLDNTFKQTMCEMIDYNVVARLSFEDLVNQLIQVAGDLPLESFDNDTMRDIYSLAHELQSQDRAIAA